VNKYFSHIGPARFWSIVEAAAAAVVMFLPITLEQGAGILGVVALLTGQQVHHKSKKQ
tara:strand:- start:200 stop:373 length:174 start_codon:yes stop_codon:yes gene_type:complete